jgi:hypothetical protein
MTTNADSSRSEFAANVREQEIAVFRLQGLFSPIGEVLSRNVERF